MKKIDLIKRVASRKSLSYLRIREELMSYGFTGDKLIGVAIQIYCQRSNKGSAEYRDLSLIGIRFCYNAWLKLPIDLAAVNRIRESTIKLNCKLLLEISNV